MSEIHEAGVHEAGDSACAGYDMHDPTTRMAKHVHAATANSAT